MNSTRFNIVFLHKFIVNLKKKKMSSKIKYKGMNSAAAQFSPHVFFS